MADWSNDSDWSNDADWSTVGGVEEDPSLDVVLVPMVNLGMGFW